MSSDLTISPLGLKLIKAYEGFSSRPKRLVTGQFVVGYGHVISAEQAGKFEDAALTRERADALLLADVKPYETIVIEGVLAPLTQNQFDALCCLAFNIGEEKFLSSNVRHALNNGRVLDAANSFDEWRKAEIGGYVYVIDVLMRRRTAEKALFLRGSYHRPAIGRYSLDALSDNSVVSISEEEHYFDPDSGIVDQLPYEAVPNPARRREDSPLGFFGLSEVEYDTPAADVETPSKLEADTSAGSEIEIGETETHKGSVKRSVFDPVTGGELAEDGLVKNSDDSFDGDVSQMTEPSSDRAIAHRANFEADTHIFDDIDSPILIEEEADVPLVLDNKIPESFIVSTDDDSALNIPHSNGIETAPDGPEDQQSAEDISDDSQEELLLTDQDPSQDVSESPAALSPIAVAAAEVSERLDALIDKSKLEADAPKTGSKATIDKIVSKGLDEKIVEFAAANDAEKPAEKAAAKTDAKLAEKLDVNIAAPTDKGQLSDSASAYIQKGKTAKQAELEKGVGAYALMMVLGGSMLAGGLVTWLTNKTGLDDLSSLLVPFSIFVGGIMVLGAFYYMLRQKLRPS